MCIMHLQIEFTQFHSTNIVFLIKGSEVISYTTFASYLHALLTLYTLQGKWELQ